MCQYRPCDFQIEFLDWGWRKDVFFFFAGLSAIVFLETEMSEEDKVKAAAAKIKAEKEAKLNAKKDSFKQAIVAFSKSTKTEDYDKAMKIKEDLMDNDNVAKEELDKVKVTAFKQYK